VVLHNLPRINIMATVMSERYRDIVISQSHNERQQSVNDLLYCIVYNPRAVLRHLPIIEVLAAFIGNLVCVCNGTAACDVSRAG